LDAIEGRNNFFVSEREILASWRIFDEILQDWDFNGENGLEFYDKGNSHKNI
jgi:glucose-6-phosphate 1-dehydrogenase